MYKIKTIYANKGILFVPKTSTVVFFFGNWIFDTLFGIIEKWKTIKMKKIFKIR